jgi:hypothetical protein
MTRDTLQMSFTDERIEWHGMVRCMMGMAQTYIFRVFLYYYIGTLLCSFQIGILGKGVQG